jgi:isopenicillin N synthase-like dioxygenase
MKLDHVPVIDLAPARLGDRAARLRVADEIDRACRDIGFLVIGGHGVDAAVIERTRATGRAFFDLPLAEKMQVARPAPHITRGYIGLEEESVARSRDPSATAGDLNESLMIGPVDPPPFDPADPIASRHFAPNLWPARPEGLREAWTAYYRAMGALAAELMRLFALALRIDEHFFDDKIDRQISRLRVRNYPAPSAPPVPGQMRVGAHSDYGSLTILHTEDRPGGLQARNAMGDWVDVPILPDTFIVNIGDLMARWTNDAWVSTMHRVVNPPAGSGAESRRQSLVFFHNPNHDAPVVCIETCLAPGEQPKYAPTTTGEHVGRLFTATQNVSAARAAG